MDIGNRQTDRKARGTSSDRRISLTRARWLAAVVLLIGWAEAHASEIEDARPMAMGGATRAQCPGNSAMYLNPAGLAAARMYHVESNYSFVPTANAHMAGASVVDSVTAPIAAGLAFNYLAWDPDGENRSEYDVRLGLAYNFGGMFSIGAMAKYLYADRDGPGPVGELAFESNGTPLLNTATVDVGASLTLGRIVHLGVVGYNLTDTGSSLAPLGLGTGLAVTLGGSFVLAADLMMDFRSRDELSLRYMGGIEYFLASHYPLRVGYRYDDARDSHSVTAGIGYINPRFGAEFGFRQDVSADRLFTFLTLSIRYFAN